MTTDVPGEAPEGDRFELEETAIVLGALPGATAEEFLRVLDDEEIGARLGDRTADGEREIVIHASNLVDAQAVLVEFTGDVELVEDVGMGTESGEDFVEVASVPLSDASSWASRLREAGIEVRLEIPDEMPDPPAPARLIVRTEDLGRAREVLGIEV